MARNNTLKLCFASSEFAPFAKTGGLADVCAALSSFLDRENHDVRVLLPLYRRVRQTDVDIQPVDFLQNLNVRIGPHDIPYSIDQVRVPGEELSIYLLRCPPLFDRDGIYTQDHDEHLRFIMLSRAAIEMCQHMGFAPDVFHVHDWHTALIPLYLKTVYAWDRLFEHTRTILTIHNIAYQGVIGRDALPDLGLGDDVGELHQGELDAGRINFLKTGILHADVVTTVSPTYASEIQGDELGMGLQDLLRARSDTLIGILNGVDYRHWDPSCDALIPHQYSSKNLAGKAKNKRKLAKELGLDVDDDVPLIGMVTRLTPQKGIDLVQQALPDLLAEKRFALAILGSGAASYESFFEWLQARHRNQVCFYRGFNNKLAHWIEAASDMFLMPSLFEPCGLNQMYSLRYGTVPIVHDTGGLADTVELFNPATGSGNGIKFRHADANALRWAIETGLGWYADKRMWRRIMRNGMAMDYSWDRQGKQYIDLYRRLSGAE